MPDFPVIRNVDPIVISSATPQGYGTYMAGIGLGISSVAWAVASKAIFTPVSIFNTVKIVKLFNINGAAVSGNIDVGIYDRGGARIVSSGSTAQAGTVSTQEYDIADTVLNPGLYYLALALDNITGAIQGWNPSAALMRCVGVHEMTSAFPLPATATFATLSGTIRIPFIGATRRTLV